MSEYSKSIVYLTQAQYEELLTNKSITANGVTVEYNANDIYVTPADIPVATASKAGVVKVGNEGTTGIKLTDGVLTISEANEIAIRNGTNNKQAITPYYEKQAVYYGLAKAAGASNTGNTVGQYTDAAKGAIQSMLGTNTMIAPDENDLVADRDYAVGDLFTANGKVYKVTSEILTGAAIVTTRNNVNCEETSVAEAFVKDVQVNGSSIVQNGKANVQLNGLYGITRNINGYLTVQLATESYIKAGITYGEPIGPNCQHYSTFYGLAKAAGHDEKDSTLPVGQYTTEAKAAIRTMLGLDNQSILNIVQEGLPAAEGVSW